MDVDLLRLQTSIADELLAHLRGRTRYFDDEVRVHATFDTTFYGCFRVEVATGSRYRVAIEHVGGDPVFDWTVGEFNRRSPATRRRREEPPAPPPPTTDEVRYRVEVVDVDAATGDRLLRSVRSLDWGEPTPDDTNGRDGIVLAGSLRDEAGVRHWVTWSPGPAVEPAKAAFFAELARLAVDHATGDLGDDIRLALG